MSNIEDIAAQYKEDAIQNEANRPTQYARFVCSVGGAKFIFKDGSVCEFIGGVFYTQDKQQYVELMEQIAARHPHISQEEGKEIVSMETVDPVAELRRKAAEYDKLLRARAIEGSMDAGSSDTSGRLIGIGNTQSVHAAMGDSTSGGTASVLTGPASALARLAAGATKAGVGKGTIAMPATPVSPAATQL